MNLPESYRVIRMTGAGGPEVLKIDYEVLRSPGQHQVLIEVRAFAINRPDIFQRKGHYPAPSGAPADIPGLEVAGIVVSCGPGVERLKVGDRICALLGGGGYAEYCLADEGHCLPLGEHLSFEKAAAIPETLFTVWHNVFERAELKESENLLVHGGSGGIGTTAIKLATFKGANVFATAGNDVRAEACVQLGAKGCVNYKTQDFEQVYQGVAFDVILDSVGGHYFEKNLRLLASDGRLVQINAIKGKKVELDLLAMMGKRWSISGSTLRPRDASFKTGLREAIESQIWSSYLIENSPLHPEIDRILEADQIREAHRALENGEVFGKVVLRW